MKLSASLLVVAAAMSTALSVPDGSAAKDLNKREVKSSPGCAKNGSWWAKCVRKDNKDSSGNVLAEEWSSGDKWCWLSEDGHQDKRLKCNKDDDPPTTEVGDDGYMVGYSCFAHTTNAAKDLDRFENGGCLADGERWDYDWGAGKAGQYKIIKSCPKDHPLYPRCA